MKHFTLLAAIALAVVLCVPALAVAMHGVIAELTGYQETPQTISTAGSGDFMGLISDDETRILFQLSYSNLEGGNPTGAHIHLGRPGLTGGIVIHFCGTGGKPACPASPGMVTGELTAADVVALPAGGIAAGELDEIIAAMRRGATYANVHNATYPGGEVREQIANPSH